MSKQKDKLRCKIKKLNQELKIARVVANARDSKARYAFSLAEDYQKRYHEVRTALVRARILVKEFKQAVVDKRAGKVIGFDIKPDEDQDVR